MTSEASARQPFPEALGGRFAVHGDIRTVEVGGSEARTWLHDIVTSDVASLPPGELRPSLLLGPTGRIRASFAMAVEERSDGEAFLLLQREDERSVGELLAPYVLSSRVRLSVDGRVPISVPEEEARSGAFRPSLLASLTRATPAGATVLLPPEGCEGYVAELEAKGLSPIEADEAEGLRMVGGVPRLGVDLDEASLPAEAAWEDRIDLTKGCFLGQESVAKVRNLGHPPRVILRLSAPRGTRPGDPVLSEGEAVGVVTSASDGPGDGVPALVRVRWQAREASLSTAAGALRRTG